MQPLALSPPPAAPFKRHSAPTRFQSSLSHTPSPSLAWMGRYYRVQVDPVQPNHNLSTTLSLYTTAGGALPSPTADHLEYTVDESYTIYAGYGQSDLQPLAVLPQAQRPGILHRKVGNIRVLRGSILGKTIAAAREGEVLEAWLRYE